MMNKGLKEYIQKFRQKLDELKEQKNKEHNNFTKPYEKLLGESDNKELSDDSQYILQKRYAYRNELAYKVVTNFEELAVAIEHNNLDLSQISKWSDNHIAETNFEKFINSSDVLYNYISIFSTIGFVLIGISILIMLFNKPLKKLMHGVR